MVLGVLLWTWLRLTGDDAPVNMVSMGHGESSDLVKKLITTREKLRAQKIEQKKKKTLGDGFQPKQELEGWVRFLQ